MEGFKEEVDIKYECDKCGREERSLPFHDGEKLIYLCEKCLLRELRKSLHAK